MWIVRLALKSPYTFVVMALLIVVLGATSISQMRTDIFPEIDIPVVTVIWTYKGMETSEVERRITTYSEYAITSNVNDIKRMESQTLNGVAVIKIYFHPGVEIGTALSQVTSVAQSIRALMPPGIQPPVVVRFNASSVPILQIGLSSETMSEEEVYDYGLYVLRTQLSTVQGLTMPTPYGGRERQVMVDLDPRLLQAKGISPKEVADAINAYNLAYPTGVARIDTHEYPVTLNNTPLTPDSFNDIPIKVGRRRNDLHARRGSGPRRQQFANDDRAAQRQPRGPGYAAEKRQRLDARHRQPGERDDAGHPGRRAAGPADRPVVRSVAVRHGGDRRAWSTESIIAGLLTATMILVFLGSWRSTLIVAVSIPLAILSSIVMLYLLGHSLNVMTLGGLALAVGILVDDATVEIENIHRNLGLGKPLRQAILDGAMQIAGPDVRFDADDQYRVRLGAVSRRSAQVSVHAAGAGRGVCHAGFVPAFAHDRPHDGRLLAAGRDWSTGTTAAAAGLAGCTPRSNAASNKSRDAYVCAAASGICAIAASVFVVFAVVVASGFVVLPWVGRDFFPTVDTGQFRLHVRAPAGTRIEQTERYFSEVENAIREIIPAARSRTGAR